MKSNILKLCLFATGLSGIVAEYILATLATYFLGDSVFQWTMVLSVMLFSMGLGSRISKWMEDHLLEKFIVIEFTLSVLVGISAALAYFLAAYTAVVGFVIYGLSILIGLMIGMEIPLVVRLNDTFEELKVNVSTVMEKDYYGSLLGGVFFVFIGLPYLGLTYTPFVLGAVNFMVALLLLIFINDWIRPERRWLFRLGAVLVVLILGLGAYFAQTIVLFGEQMRYRDKVVYSDQSRYQNIVITQWKEHYWFYLNGNQQLSTLDEHLYHEPMTHPLIKLVGHAEDVLVLGGGDGCVVRELLHYDHIKTITLVDLDPKVTQLAKEHPIFVEMNDSALYSPKVKIINADAYSFLETTLNFYDAIIADFPDPKSIELARLFSLEFYQMAYRQLRPMGGIIVQAGSPYYATKAFECVNKTMRAAGFSTAKLHNQIMSLGQWGWVLGSKAIPQDSLVPALQRLHFDDIPTRWLNHDAMLHITSFGKPLVPLDTAGIQINRVHDPVLNTYYLKGNWDWY